MASKTALTLALYSLLLLAPLTARAAVTDSRPLSLQKQTPQTINNNKNMITPSAKYSRGNGGFRINQSLMSKVWLPGSTQAIKWTKIGTPGQHVKISLYRGNLFDREIVTSMPVSEGESIFSWIIPANIIQAENYYIVVQSVEFPELKTTSDQIRIHGQLNITEPSAQNSWTPGAPQIIRWKHVGKPGNNVKIVLLENGKPTTTLTSSTSVGENGNGLAAWDIPENKSQSATYAVMIQSLEYPFIKSVSQNFKLMGKIELLSPLPGQNVVNGYNLTINGKTYGCGSDVRVSVGYPTYSGGGSGFGYKETANFVIPVKNREFSYTYKPSGLIKGINAVWVSCVAKPDIKAVAGGLEGN